MTILKIIHKAADKTIEKMGHYSKKANVVANFENFVEVCEKANSSIKTIILDTLFVYARSSAKVKMPLLERNC